MSRTARAAVAVLLAFVATAAFAAPAAAHAALESTTPAAGAVLDEPPSELVARFNQRVKVGAGLQLHDAEGRRVDDGRVVSEDGGRVLRMPVDGLAEGGYVFTFRVVSEDGHPISGGVTFRVGAGSAAVDEGLLQEMLEAESGDTVVRGVAAAVRTLLFGAVLVLAGGAVFVLGVWGRGRDDRRLRVVLLGAAVVGLVTTVAGMGLQGADVAGRGLGHALKPSTLGDVADTEYGRMALARLVLLAIAAVLVALLPRWRTTVWRLGALATVAGVLATITYSGHARTGRWTALAAPVDLVHLGAAAAWLGGLVIVLFLVLPRVDEDEGVAIVGRFSSVAWWAVIVVVVTGVVQGVRQVGGLGDIGDTNYGRMLVVKVALVGVVLALAAMARANLGERVTLRRAVGAEAALAVVVLAVTSLLVAADPEATETGGDAFGKTVVVDGTLVEVIAAPAAAGPVDFHVYVSDPAMGLTTPVDVAATMSLPSEDIPPLDIPVRPAGGRHWSAYDVDVPIAGTWRLVVDLTIGDGIAKRATFAVPVD